MVDAVECFLSGAAARCADTQGVLARFYCQGKCGRYVLSHVAMDHIESQVLKDTWATQAALDQAGGWILLLRFEDGQLKRERITPDDKVWSETPW